MACGAFKCGVRASKGITGVAKVVELRVKPAVHRVTGLAGGREAQTDVINNRSKKVLLMAGIAGRRQAHELARRGILVAIFALQKRMGSHQRESILVVLNCLQRNLPAFHRVAVRAIGAKLPPMNICMAVGTLRTYIFEDQARVALGATHVLVHAAERISGEIVVEFRICPDRFPTRVGVTVCAGDRKRAMGIGHLGLGYADASSHAGTVA